MRGLINTCADNPETAALTANIYDFNSSSFPGEETIENFVLTFNAGFSSCFIRFCGVWGSRNGCCSWSLAGGSSPWGDSLGPGPAAAGHEPLTISQEGSLECCRGQLVPQKRLFDP